MKSKSIFNYKFIRHEHTQFAGAKAEEGLGQCQEETPIK